MGVVLLGGPGPTFGGRKGDSENVVSDRGKSRIVPVVLGVDLWSVELLSLVRTYMLGVVSGDVSPPGLDGTGRG